MGFGQGIKTKVELLAAWGLMHLETQINLPIISIGGDSKIIIDWLSGKSNL